MQEDVNSPFFLVYLVAVAQGYTLLSSSSFSFFPRAILDGDDYPMLMTMHLAITSRLLLGHPNQFIEFSLNLATEADKTQDEVAGE